MEDDKQIANVESRIITLRNRQVIIDRDVAELYGVETKAVNQAVKRNADKFPPDYMFQLGDDEKQEVVTNCDHLGNLRFSRTLPYAFTEQGLYMLATILKSPMAKDVTFAIINTFTKLRVLARGLQHINDTIANGGVPTEKEQGTVKGLMNTIFQDPLPIKVQKFTFGLNLGFVKFSMETTLEKK